MTEEENKAIEDLKLTIEQEKEELPYSKESLKNNETLLNLIEKLQKENGELKENERYMKDFFGEEICTLKNDKERFKRYGIQKEEEIKELKSNSIPKDLVIKKIQEQNQKIIAYSECFGYEEANQCNYCRIILEELLEEE